MKKTLLAFILSIAIIIPAKADILIGVSAPTTGPAASLGEQIIAGVNLAVAKINQSGGINGEKLVIKAEDDACDPKQALNAVNRLISAKASLIIGPACSGAFMAASDVTAEENIPHLTATASNPDITERGLKNIFRVYGRDDQQAVILADHIGKNYGKQNIAIIHDKSTWGKGLADATKNNLNEAGVKEALFDTITVGEKDFSPLVTKLKAKGINTVLLAVFPVEAGAIVRQAAELKLNIKFFGGDAAMVNEFWAVANKTGNGFTFTGPADPTKGKQGESILKQFAAKKVKPEVFTLYAYAATEIAAQAMQQSKELNSASILKNLHSGKFSTIMGSLQFDKKGDLTDPAFKLYEWQNGKYQYLTGAM